MPEAYALSLPAEYFEWLRWLNWLNLDWLSLAAPASCFGTFDKQLLLKTLGPIVALTALVVGAALSAAVGHCRSSEGADGTHGLEAARRGVMRVLPLTITILFALVPSVCARVFSTFSCELFGFDDAAGLSLSFLYADNSIECVGAAYDDLRRLATALVVLWPIGVPALFLSLLVASCSKASWAVALSRAVRVLHSEYRGEMFYWEIFEISRKLVLTGFVFLIPREDAALRLIVAILVCVAHLVVLQAAAPFRSRSTYFFAIAASLTLLCTFQASHPPHPASGSVGASPCSPFLGASPFRRHCSSAFTKSSRCSGARSTFSPSTSARCA